MPWIRRRLRGNDVWVRTDDGGQPQVGPDGRVDVAYKLSGNAKVYRAGLRNLEKTGDAADETPRQAPEGGPSERATARTASKSGGAKRGKPIESDRDLPTPGPDTIVIYTDGACTGNPGPMGIGAVVLDRGERREISEYLGARGTNNIAELTAIERALRTIDAADRGRDVWVHTDSGYSIGVLSKGWKAKANQALIADIRALLGDFPAVRFIHVRGHAGIAENERCDELGRAAIARGH